MGVEPHFRDGPVITIDGSSGSGKSTLSRKLAAALGWPFLDSGAWYRALAWACLEAGVDPKDSAAVLNTLSSIEIRSDAHGQVYVDGVCCTGNLRTPAIDAAVSLVADHLEVRALLNEKMRGLHLSADAPGMVADGRDAGTIIFPNAALKIFVEASLEVRAERRFRQMAENGIEITLSEVQHALALRDAHDATRGDAAPHPTERSRILTNENLTVEEAVGCLLAWAEKLNP